MKEGYLDSGHNRGRKDIWVQDITVEGKISRFRILPWKEGYLGSGYNCGRKDI